MATLGITSVRVGDRSLDGDWLRHRPGQLLCYLVAERGRPLTVEQIGESIWPGCDYSIAPSVRYQVHALRRRLEPELAPRACSRFISSLAGAYRLDLADVEVDADEFERRVYSGLDAHARGAACAGDELQRGLELYGGEFLAELPYVEWALAERERLHELACRGLRALAQVRREEDRADCAAACLERLVRMQPYDEDVYRELIALDILRGRRSDAVRRYAVLRVRMNRAFGQEPTFTPAEVANSPI